MFSAIKFRTIRGPYTRICPEGDVALFVFLKGRGPALHLLGPAQPLKIIDFTDSRGGGGGAEPPSIPAYAFDNNKTDPLNVSNISVFLH